MSFFLEDYEPVRVAPGTFYRAACVQPGVVTRYTNENAFVKKCNEGYVSEPDSRVTDGLAEIQLDNLPPSYAYNGTTVPPQIETSGHNPRTGAPERAWKKIPLRPRPTSMTALPDSIWNDIITAEGFSCKETFEKCTSLSNRLRQCDWMYLCDRLGLPKKVTYRGAELDDKQRYKLGCYLHLHELPNEYLQSTDGLYVSGATINSEINTHKVNIGGNFATSRYAYINLYNNEHRRIQSRVYYENGTRNRPSADGPAYERFYDVGGTYERRIQSRVYYENGVRNRPSADGPAYEQFYDVDGTYERRIQARQYYENGA